MPSRKHRRRREKSRRHEYEYVLVDETGEEIEVEPTEVKKETRARNGTKPKAAQTRRVREVQPPSWNRVGKRALIFAPAMFIVVNLLGKKISVEQRVIETVFLLGFFLPFSYVMDMVAYRAYRKRLER